MTEDRRQEIRLAMPRCLSAAELAGFLDQLSRMGEATPEMRNLAQVIRDERGWR